MKGSNVRFVGIDLGKRSMEVHFIRTDEKHESWTCKTDAEGRARLIHKLLPTDVLAMEACPLAFILEAQIRKQVGARVCVLNPLGLAMIYQSTKKTDREDAAKLAWVVQRLPEAELPTVTIPTEQEQELRFLVSEQVTTTQSRTREINRLHALFVQDGITTVTKRDLRHPKSRSLKLSELSQTVRPRAERYDKVIAVLEQNLETVEAELLSIVVDGKLKGRSGQAASAITPSRNLVPATTWGRKWKPSSLRQVFSAWRHSLKTIARVA